MLSFLYALFSQDFQDFESSYLWNGSRSSYLPGGGEGAKIRPLLFFIHHPKKAKGIKLKLADFKDTPLRHILQVKLVRYILSCCHGNKIQIVPRRIRLQKKVKISHL